MAKKKKAKKKVKKGAEGTKGTKDKASKKGGKSKYKRGSLSAVIYAHFDKVGVDEAKFEKTLEIAKATKPDTKYNRYHFSWYKNKYRQQQEE